MESVEQLEQRVSTHEIICEQRYKSNAETLDEIKGKVKRLENVMVVCAGGIMTLLASIVIKLA